MNKLKTAKEKYKKGTTFLSATGNIKRKLIVTNLKLSDISGDIVEENGGVIYDNFMDVWAEIV